jgi:hypothetical protein
LSGRRQSAWARRSARLPRRYRYDSATNIAAEAFLDTRVFTIFDDTNDLLSQQLTEFCLARRAGRPLSGFLATWPLTPPGIVAHRLDLRFLLPRGAQGDLHRPRGRQRRPV